MVSQKVIIQNPTGLHLRPAGILCKTAMQFKALITFTFENTTANAKSVLSVLEPVLSPGMRLSSSVRVWTKKQLWRP